MLPQADPQNLFFDPATGDWGLALYGHTRMVKTGPSS